MLEFFPTRLVNASTGATNPKQARRRLFLVGIKSEERRACWACPQACSSLGETRRHELGTANSEGRAHCAAPTGGHEPIGGSN